MAVQKNFVIRNGLEVNNNLLVADSSTDYVGIGTSSPKYTLEVIGGIGVTYANILGIATVGQEFNVGTGGTVITSLNTGLTGFGTAIPAYVVDIRSPVSTGQTALYVQGDVRVTGDLYADDINLDQATFNNIEVTGIATVGIITANDLYVGFTTTSSLAVVHPTKAVLTVGHDIDGSGQDHFGIYYDNTPGTPGTGGTANVFVSNGDLRLDVVDGVSNFIFGSQFTNDYVVINGFDGAVTIAGFVTASNGYLGVGTITDFYATDATISGLTTTGSLAVNTGFDVYATDSTFHGNVTIDGNLSIGGTSAILNAVQVRIEDKDIVLGFTTSVTPSDDTANHGGIAIASTEGYPLISMSASGINTLPDTYKQIMWLKRNTMGAGTTDAFLFNYAVGVGSTQVPNGVRFAAGSIQFTDNVINTTNLNVTGVGTIRTASIDLGNVKTGIVTNLSTSGIASITTAVIGTGNINTGVVTTISGSNLNYSGIGTIGTASVDLGYIKTGITTNLITTGIASIATGIVTTLSGSNLSYTGIVTAGSVTINGTSVISSGRQLQNIASLDATTIATIEAAIANAPNTFQDLQVTGIASVNTGVFTSLYANTGIVTTLTSNTFNVGTGGTVLSVSSNGTFAIGSATTVVTATLNGGAIPSIGLVIALGG